ncbi:MAG: hypothetical protein HOP28_18205 [Gemmatimonadales bacterium]|nr:hypothetical protein [Gemmatimonadales bacterium]
MKLPTLLPLLLASRLAAQDCTVTMAAPEVRSLAAALDKAAAVGPVWSDYTIANHPVVFVSQTPDTTASVCASVWRFRKPPVVVAMSRRVRFSTPLYGMWNGDSVRRDPSQGNAGIASSLRPIPPELEQVLRGMGEIRVVFLPVPLRFETLGALGRSLQAMKIDPTLMMSQLAVHESYHLHSQIPTWLGQPGRYDWPAWDVQPDRKALVEQCYAGTPAVTDLRRREMEALLAAWDTLMAERSAASDARAIASAKTFISTRRERYALLAAVTIPSPAGPVSCERAEDVMELEEGAPQWMAYVTAVRAGLMQATQVGRASNESFYVTGTFQLWILERLLGNSAMRALTKKITRAARPDGPEGAIFQRFSAIVDDEHAATKGEP